MAKRRNLPKPKLVVSNNVIDLEAVREERLPTIFIVDEGDPRSDTKEMLEMAAKEFSKDKNITGGFITFTDKEGNLINLAAGITLSDEVLLRQVATQDRLDEWRDYGEDFDAE